LPNEKGRLSRAAFLLLSNSDIENQNLTTPVYDELLQPFFKNAAQMLRLLKYCGPGNRKAMLAA
jgi:hypothetical protein